MSLNVFRMCILNYSKLFRYTCKLGVRRFLCLLKVMGLSREYTERSVKGGWISVSGKKKKRKRKGNGEG